MTRIERLARRICWMGFVDPRKTGWTETTYWQGLPTETRDKYREEARWLCWAADELNASKTGREILQRAVAQRRAA